LGTIEDFFFEEGTSSISAFLVHTRVLGDYALSIYAIEAIEAERITIDNQDMLLRALPPLPNGQGLLERKVVNESGDLIGSVSDIYINVEAVRVLFISALELKPKRGGRVKAFTTDAVVSYTNDGVVIYNYLARKLR
jgi:uncharacterized protein YrrD